MVLYSVKIRNSGEKNLMFSFLYKIQISELFYESVNKTSREKGLGGTKGLKNDTKGRYELCPTSKTIGYFLILSDSNRQNVFSRSLL
jgi:hypothetical protein